MDGDLGTGAGLAGDGFDLDRAGCNLRNLQLEQALDEARVRPGDDDLRAAVAAAHLDNVDADHIALGIMLGRNLLRP